MGHLDAQNIASEPAVDSIHGMDLDQFDISGSFDSSITEDIPGMDAIQAATDKEATSIADTIRNQRLAQVLADEHNARLDS